MTDLCPEITLTLMFDGGDANLGMREADVAVRIGCPDRASLVQRGLLSSRLFAYAAPAYVEAHGLPEPAEDLDDHQLVVCQGSADLSSRVATGCSRPVPALPSDDDPSRRSIRFMACSTQSEAGSASPSCRISSPPTPPG